MYSTGPPAPLHTIVCDVAQGGHFFLGRKNMNIKVPKTFSEQVDKIEEKGIIICNKDYCRNFFKRVNYYRFSAYLLPFRNCDKTYKEGTQFEHARKIYEFDTKIRNLIFQTIENIEVYLRTQMAYHHAHKYGSVGYEDSSTFGPKHNKKAFDEKIEGIKHKNRSTLVFKHHTENYAGKIPLWVIIEYFTMGEVSYFYSDLKTEDKKEIAAALYDTIPDNLDSWLRCITDLRNRCAHYSRLYYWKFSALPVIPIDLKHTAERRLLDQILVLKFLFPAKEEWEVSFFKPFEELIKEYENEIEFWHIGLINNWEELLKG